MQISDLWRWDGTIDRAPYFAWGVILVLIKYFIDVTVSNLVFHHPWSILEYFAPGAGMKFGQLSAADYTFYMSMLLMSLPFAWTGSVLTIRRLRAAQLPPWLVILFYVPVANLIFFKVLTWTPSHGESDELALSADMKVTDQLLIDKQKKEKKDLEHLLAHSQAPQSAIIAARHPGKIGGLAFIERWIPETEGKALFAAALLPIAPAVALAAFSTIVLGSYGGGVFVALPFVMSIMAAVFYGYREPRTLLDCAKASILCLLLCASVLLIIPIEGIICLLMAAPVAIVIGFLGACLGYAIQKNLPREPQIPKIIAGIIILIPFIMVGEHALMTDVPLYKVTTCVDVNASPEVVWNHVVSFSELSPPTEWYFKTGIAYPVRATIKGHGVGAVRHCVFSTGPFVEPIYRWDEPRVLEFGVTQQPEPMTELSPYANLHPKHLDNYLVSKRGRFNLIPLSANRTRLEGTTWYQNYMEPGPYWRIFSDGIIHGIHERVLNHVKHLAEEPQVGARTRAQEHL